jgi:hypothetical protein
MGTVKRITRPTGAGAGRHQLEAAGAASTTSASASTPETIRQGDRDGAATMVRARSSSGAADIASAISRRAAAIESRRWARSFCRQRRNSRRTGTGVSGGSVSSGIESFNTDASTSETSLPVNARRPVSISKSTTPNAQTSARRSTGLPRACSGLMYAAVPRINPSSVAGLVIVGEFARLAETAPLPSVPIALARPKSSTFTTPSGLSLMFAVSDRDG